MTDQPAMVAFASEKWLELVRGTLREIVEREGREGVTASMCEVFVGAPDDSIGMTEPGRAAWHFRVNGKRCDVEAGEASDVDLKVVFDFQSAVPFARAVTCADSHSAPPMIEMHGDPTKVPTYLIDLHNALAVHTA